MLVLTRNAGQCVRVGPDINVQVWAVTGAGEAWVKVFRSNGLGVWIEDEESPHIMREGVSLTLGLDITMWCAPRKGPRFLADCKKRTARLGFEAPDHVRIVRDDAINTEEKR